MSTSDETAANEAVKSALQALHRAKELRERAGYGALVLGPLDEAVRETQYALHTALGVTEETQHGLQNWRMSGSVRWKSLQ